ncbi:Endoplasmic reticulum junction formation protein lunapark [Entamoeba marina]
MSNLSRYLLKKYITALVLYFFQLIGCTGMLYSFREYVTIHWVIGYVIIQCILLFITFKICEMSNSTITATQMDIENGKILVSHKIDKLLSDARIDKIMKIANEYSFQRKKHIKIVQDQINKTINDKCKKYEEALRKEFNEEFKKKYDELKISLEAELKVKLEKEYKEKVLKEQERTKQTLALYQDRAYFSSSVLNTPQHQPVNSKISDATKPIRLFDTKNVDESYVDSNQTTILHDESDTLDTSYDDIEDQETKTTEQKEITETEVEEETTYEENTTKENQSDVTPPKQIHKLIKGKKSNTGGVAFINCDHNNLIVVKHRDLTITPDIPPPTIYVEASKQQPKQQLITSFIDMLSGVKFDTFCCGNCHKESWVVDPTSKEMTKQCRNCKAMNNFYTHAKSS